MFTSMKKIFLFALVSTSFLVQGMEQQQQQIKQLRSEYPFQQKLIKVTRKEYDQKMEKELNKIRAEITSCQKISERKKLPLFRIIKKSIEKLKLQLKRTLENIDFDKEMDLADKFIKNYYIIAKHCSNTFKSAPVFESILCRIKIKNLNNVLDDLFSCLSTDRITGIPYYKEQKYIMQCTILYYVQNNLSPIKTYIDDIITTVSSARINYFQELNQMFCFASVFATLSCTSKLLKPSTKLSFKKILLSGLLGSSVSAGISITRNIPKKKEEIQAAKKKLLDILNSEKKAISSIENKIHMHSKKINYKIKCNNKLYEKLEIQAFYDCIINTYLWEQTSPILRK